MTTAFIAAGITILILALAWGWSIACDVLANWLLNIRDARRKRRGERFRRMLRIARSARARGVVLGAFEAQKQLRDRALAVERMFAQRELACRN